MHRFLSVLGLVALAACSGDDTFTLVHGIVSGQDQVVTAGVPQLAEPVVQRIARTSSGVAMYRVDPEKVLDLVVPRAYAQTGTVVRGSPVPGAVVCVGEAKGLTPFVQCTNTDADGNATFFFEPDTRAGVHTAEIRGSVDGFPAVFDTARATVVAGPPDPMQAWNWAPMPSPATLFAASVADAYGNAIPYRIVSDRQITVQGAEAGTDAARTVTFGADLVDHTTWYVTDFLGSNGAVIARGHYRFVISDDKPSIEWRVRGTAASF